MQRGRGQRILPRAGHQRHGAHGAAHVGHGVRGGTLGRADHLERELRHAVAEAREVEVLDHHVGDAPVGGREARPLHRLDLGIGALRLVAGIDPQAQRGGVDLGPVGPDAPYGGDDALAQREREADGIGIARRRDAGLGRRPLAPAGRGGGDVLAEPRRPDHLPRDAVAPEKERDRRPLGRARKAEPLDPPGLHRLRARPHQALVDDAAERGAHGAPDHRAGEAEHGAAEARADGGAGGGEKDRGHLRSSFRGMRSARRRAAPRARSAHARPWRDRNRRG